MAQLIDWFEHHFGTAAWVQTIAAILGILVSIIGIGVAIYVPAKQAADARRAAEIDRRMKARSLAIAIYPELLAMEANLEAVIPRLQRDFDHIPGPWPQWTQNMLDELQLEIPPTLAASVGELYLLGQDAGGDIQQLVSLTRAYQAILDGMYVKKPDFEPRLLLGPAKLCKQALDGASKAIQPIHDEPVKGGY